MLRVLFLLILSPRFRKPLGVMLKDLTRSIGHSVKLELKAEFGTLFLRLASMGICKMFGFSILNDDARSTPFPLTVRKCVSIMIKVSVIFFFLITELLLLTSLPDSLYAINTTH